MPESSSGTRLGTAVVCCLLVACLGVSSAEPFTSLWEIPNARQLLELPLVDGGLYNFTVDWGDGSAVNTIASSYAEHTYTSAGNYTIEIDGTIEGWAFNYNIYSELIRNISRWGPLQLGSAQGHFAGCTKLESLPGNIDLVGTKEDMFKHAYAFNADTSGWDTSAVTNMKQMFHHAEAFNGDLTYWSTGSVTTFEQMFVAAGKLNQDLYFDTSQATSMRSMFYGATTFNGDVSSWDVSNVEDFSIMFEDASRFNANVSNWDTSSALAMDYMFAWAEDFNTDLALWNVSQVKSFDAMFRESLSFANPDLSSWDTRKATSMRDMFYKTVRFNGKLNTWDVSQMTDLTNMFELATSFNSDLSLWDVSKVTTMDSLFAHAGNFNGVLSAWDVSSVTVFQYMFSNAVNFSGDLGPWDTALATTMMNMFDSTMNFNGSLDSWDTARVTSLEATFAWAFAFNGNITSWDTSKVTTAHRFMQGTQNFNGDLGNWDTSNIGSMVDMFERAFAFNGDLSTWDVARVTDSRSMFAYTKLFNSDIQAWDVSRVTNFGYMFAYSELFNSDVQAWDTSSGIYMNGMFDASFVFNGTIEEWDVSNVRTLQSIFKCAYQFNGKLGDWDISSVTSLEDVFYAAISFNQDVSAWDTSQVTSLAYAFSEAMAFRGDVSSWDVSKVEDMAFAFCDTIAWVDGEVECVADGRAFDEQFHGSLTTWNMSKVTDCRDLCKYCELPSQMACTPCTPLRRNARGKPQCLCTPAEGQVRDWCVAIDNKEVIETQVNSTCTSIGIPTASTTQTITCEFPEDFPSDVFPNLPPTGVTLDNLTESTLVSLVISVRLLDSGGNEVVLVDLPNGQELTFTLLATSINDTTLVRKAGLAERCKPLPPPVNTLACVWWDHAQDDWNPAGCTAEDQGSGQVLCTCTHATEFALVVREDHAASVECLTEVPHTQDGSAAAFFVLAVLYLGLGVFASVQLTRLVVASCTQGKVAWRLSAQHATLVIVCAARVVVLTLRAMRNLNVGSDGSVPASVLVLLASVPYSLEFASFADLFLIYLEVVLCMKRELLRILKPLSLAILVPVLLCGIVVPIIVHVLPAPLRTDLAIAASYLMAALVLFLCVALVVPGMLVFHQLRSVRLSAATSSKVDVRVFATTAALALSLCVQSVCWVFSIRQALVDGMSGRTRGMEALVIDVLFYAFALLTVCALLGLRVNSVAKRTALSTASSSSSSSKSRLQLTSQVSFAGVSSAQSTGQY